MKYSSSKKNKAAKERTVNNIGSPQEMGLEARSEWILDLAQNETMSLDDPQALRVFQQQLGKYLKGICIRRKDGDHGAPDLMIPGEPLLPDELPMRETDNEKPLDDKLALIRTSLKRVLKEFLHPSVMPVSLTSDVMLRYSLKEIEGRREFQEELIADDIRTALRFRLLQDLSTADDLIRECPSEGCGKLLVRHYRKEFCSPSCRNRTNARKWYERNKDKLSLTVKRAEKKSMGRRNVGAKAKQS